MPDPCYYCSSGPFQNKERASLQFKPYGLEFSSCDLKPFGDYSCPNQLPALIKKKKSCLQRTFGHRVAIAKEHIVGDLSVKEPETYGLHFLLNEHGLQNQRMEE